MSRNFRLGVFVTAILLMLAAGVFLIGRNSFLFSSTYRLRAEFPKVAGLSPGAEVRVGGTRQGAVRRIDLPARPDGKVVVLIDLDTGTRNVVKKDSVASIKAEGLMGAKYVEISFGSNEVEGVKNGDTIGSEPPVDLGELMKTASDVLDSAKDAVDNVQSISEKIDRGKGAAGSFVNDTRVYQEASAAAAEAKAGATAFHENMAAMRRNFLLRGFFRKRGYEDSSELTKHAISQLPTGPQLKRFVYRGADLFAGPDNAKLKNQKSLKEVGTFLEKNGFGLAVVVSHSGTAGDSEKNRVLTEARAMVLRDYLAKNFKIDDTRLKTKGAGEASTVSESGKIDIIVFPVGKASPRANGSSKRPAGE